jgi:acetyl esterase/lipase
VIAGDAPSDLLRFCSGIKDAVGDCDGDLEEYLGADGGAVYLQASPLFNVGPGASPFLLIQGTQDVCVGEDQSVQLQAALEDAGDSASLLLISGGGHVLNPGADLGALDTPEDSIDTPEGWAAILQFLAATLGTPP